VLVLVLFCGSVLAISSPSMNPPRSGRHGYRNWSTASKRRSIPSAGPGEGSEVGRADRKGDGHRAQSPGAQVVVKDEQGTLSKVFEQSRILLRQIIATIILTFFLLSTDAPVISDRVLASFGGTGRRLRSASRNACSRWRATWALWP
jgi:hypothetical protein